VNEWSTDCGSVAFWIRLVLVVFHHVFFSLLTTTTSVLTLIYTGLYYLVHSHHGISSRVTVMLHYHYFYRVTQKYLRVEDHISLPLDALSSKRRIRAVMQCNRMSV
jgi:hypothetical protein